MTTAKYPLERLQSLSVRLDLLAAGSWLLVPSMIIYHASAVIALQQPDGQSLFPRDGQHDIMLVCLRPWLMTLGLLTPIVTYRVLVVTFPTGGSSSNSHCSATYYSYAGFRNWFLTRLHRGRSRDHKEKEEEEEGGCLLPTTAAKTLEHCSHPQRLQEPWSLLSKAPRRSLKPRTLLFQSLSLWTFLMFLSSQLGLDHSASFVSVPLALDARALRDAQSTAMSAASTLPSASLPRSWSLSLLEPSQLQQLNPDCSTILMAWEDVVEQYDYTSEAFVEPVAQRNEILMEDLEAMVRAADDDEVMDSEWIMPDRSRAPTMEVDEHGSNTIEVDNEMENEVEELRDINEQRDRSALLDFCVMQREEIDGKDDDGLGNNYGLSDAHPLVPPVVSNSGRVLEYVPGWTEAMLFMISLCVGTVALGIRLARGEAIALASDLMKQQPQQHVVLGYPWVRRTWSLTAASLLVYWTFHTHTFDLPSSAMACFGVVFTIMVRAWVPKDLNTAVYGAGAVEALSRDGRDLDYTFYIPMPSEIVKTEENRSA
ncbi:hypothetical protein BGZ99_009107 [Dissophora globulifera]|uniref:Uncharacterized protein n=1 Tax=Dissophora globulifera TaxID=979702 RepID=A0A9P6RRP0_9FUNG|nr:hypothetical protein BGZ99_009107 [Dissophora globulifera]